MDVDPTTTDWINAIASAVLVITAIIGFGLTLSALIAARNRQRLEVEGYVRVDVGPPDGTDDYKPPTDVAYVQSAYLQTMGRTTKKSPVLSAWYRNLQQHPLGVAFGVAARVSITAIDRADNVHEMSQTHEIAYLEPGKTVRIDCVRFPASWDCLCRLEAIQYRNLHWDGLITRHGRRDCFYTGGEYEMVPWSDPTTVWRDRWAGLVAIPSTLKRLMIRQDATPSDQE